MTSGSAIFAGKTLDLWGLGPGGDRRKSIYHKHLGTQIHAKRTDVVVALTSKGGYNAYMKKNDDNILPSLTNDEAFNMMDLVFKAGWEFGKSCIAPTSVDALRLFKDTIKSPELASLLDSVIRNGIKKTDRLHAAEAKKNAEMN